MFINTPTILKILLKRSNLNRHRGLTNDACVANVFTTSRKALIRCETINSVIALPYLYPSHSTSWKGIKAVETSKAR